MSLTTRRTTHRLTIDAPADLIFAMLRDSSHWPYLDGLTVYSERVSGDDADHELRTSVRGQRLPQFQPLPPGL